METLRKILVIRHRKQMSDTSRSRRRATREFHEEARLAMGGASTFDEMRRRFSLRNDFYRPCEKYGEEELLGSTTREEEAKAQCNARKRAESVQKRFSVIAAIVDRSEQRFVEESPAFKFIVINDQSPSLPQCRNSGSSRASIIQPNTPSPPATLMAKTARVTPHRQWPQNSANTTPRRDPRVRPSGKLRRLNRLIENCRGLESESSQYENRVGREKREMRRIFVQVEEHNRIVTASEYCGVC